MRKASLSNTAKSRELIKTDMTLHNKDCALTMADLKVFFKDHDFMSRLLKCIISQLLLMNKIPYISN